ncbi:hypothetical protein HQ325_16530 [Rhodococcus sp. BP-349]|uniref:hypothetical protein n=1 Tax=unclassified Rhodococcus (in: high G+C Gram-positive bacteria) TaxID=192944 RepID=UPI001C9B5851|nr:MULTISPECIES: hypothetical protein [unclassified Rhodococcus (in: high G+C Gram-positive bacteria)]MBY6540282.1 hypothetical protein [Rhodococcus sp. BP-363]MBY6545693.1 hypothetical protein [Rhodococcus sp. BP-369]MBY6564923.1 hypothetical protein [Rhodococcus sp. BP-370]MBY6578141.1 hypothetical protein [Rhodococcus sp. BP-364]MBY6587442.1 hypothetical protein [Rhodococcus sp. BP-358]
MTSRDTPDHRAGRTITVHIPAFMVEDRSFRPPEIGGIVCGPLDFHENPPTDGDAATIRGHLTPSDDGPRWLCVPAGTPPRWVWSGFLRGDGWTARWLGFTPRTGQVEITGHFAGGFDYATDGTVRGRVTRIQVVSERHHRHTDGQLLPTPGRRSLRDVDRTDGTVVGRGGSPEVGGDHVDLDTLVIVDLDLDDVPPLPPRPSIVPGGVSAAAATVWVIDSELPLVVAVSGGDTVTEYLLPGRTGVSRLLWATPGGCWVAGEDGTFWIPHGGNPVRVDDRSVHAGAVHGDVLLGCTDDSLWRMYRPGTEPVDVDVSPAAGHTFAVVAHDDGFVAVVRRHGSGTRLVRVPLVGTAQVGPDISADPEPGQRRRWWRDFFLAGDPLRLISHVDVGVIEPDLGVRDDGERLGRRQFHGGTVGDYGWSLGFLGHDASSPRDWWPLPDRSAFDRATEMLRSPRTVFTLYDSRTLTPLTSVPMHDPEPSVTIDDSGTVLVVDRGITTFPTDLPVMTSPATLDVAALLDRSREELRPIADVNDQPTQKDVRE